MMRVSFIGSGNVATQLALAFYAMDSINIVQIISRTQNNARKLGKQVHASYTNQIQDLNPETDLILVAVNDDALFKVAKSLPILDAGQIICHCAGSVQSTIFKDKSHNFGCFYPLQTISKSRDIEWDQVPVLITSNNPFVDKTLVRLAQCLSNHVQSVNDEQRMALHVAAVFSCNFSNAMYQIGARICEDNQVPFTYLHPLIKETAQKILNLHPREAQTGPAIRNDTWIINKHTKWLKDQTHRDIYYTLSAFIQNQ
jgi:predicted short-subunit dehydrogenase-like oxidoreductase (DUF2520 family)